MKTEKEILEMIERHYAYARKDLDRGGHPSDYESAWNRGLEWVVGKEKSNKIRKKYGFIESK